MVTLRKQINETEDAYIFRICSYKDNIGTWNDVQNILNRELNKDWTESAYRKKFQIWNKMPYSDIKVTDETIKRHEELVDQIRKERNILEKERYKLQTEKLELNKWRREDARDELFEEQVLNSIRTQIGTSPSPTPIPIKRNTRGGVLCLADIHFGADFKIYGVRNEIINEYSPEIFYVRMNKLLGEIIDFIAKEKLNYLKVFNLGDTLDGFLRHSQIWNLRFGVVDSAIIFADYMANWLNKLSHYAAIEYYSTNGNHGELRLLDGKKAQHSNENIEKIVTHIISLVNKDNDNFEVIENDSGLIYTNIVGFNVLGIHGEEKNFSEAIKNFSQAYDVPIDYLFAGHKHHISYEECGVRKGVIGIGSIVGSDDYSLSLKKTANSSASLIIFEKDKGKVDEHTFILN